MMKQPSKKMFRQRAISSCSLHHGKQIRLVAVSVSMTYGILHDTGISLDIGPGPLRRMRQAVEWCTLLLCATSADRNESLT